MRAPSVLLSIESLSKSFAGLTVIDGVTMSVDRGERVALIGPNGAGKTTLFNLITGAYPVSAGRILLDGREITDMADWRRARLGVARSFQNIRLMPHLSAIENVMLGQHPRAHGVLQQLAPIGWPRNNRWRREAAEALERAGLGDVADEAVYNLPYGIQKRIELVRATLAHPRVLLLDEPAAGLNRRETEDLAALLRTLSQTGLTLLVVEHDMHFVGRLCQRLIVLNFGRKIAEGSPSQVQRDPAVVEAYLGSNRSLEAAHAS